MLTGLLNKINLDRVNKNLLRFLLALSGIKISHAYYKYSHILKNPVLNATILLPGKGCAWARQEGGGCTMCGFQSALSSIGIKRNFSDAELLRIFDLGLDVARSKRAQIINIYNAGSFLNENEVPKVVQEGIAARVKDSPDIREAFIESRPEFINTNTLNNLVSLLRPKGLKVGIGLEAEDDIVRNQHINKGISKEAYEGAVKAAHSAGARVLTYLLIKPLGLREKEAIEEAALSAKYAFSHGSDEVSFEAACIHKGTKMEESYKSGEYRPPWLWSVIEVLKRAHLTGNVQIGSFWDFPAPLAKPYNCIKCSSRIEKLLGEYRKSHDITIFYNLNCSCKTSWLKELQNQESYV